MIRLRSGNNSLFKKIKLDSKLKTLGSNTVIFAIGNVMSKLILFLLMPLYTSAMTPSEYGFAELMSNGIDLLMPLATLCLYEAVFRFSIDSKKNERILILSNSFRIIFWINLVVTFITIVASLATRSFYPILFCIMLVTYSIRQIFAQFSRGIGDSKRFAISGILNAFVLGISNIILVGYFSYGIYGYLISIAFGNVSSAIYLYFVVGLNSYLKPQMNDKELLKEMLFFSVPMIPNSISWWFANISTRYILVMFEGLATAGIFTAISKLPSIINVLSSIFQQAWQFSASKEISKKDANSFFSKVFISYYTLIISSCSIIITFIPFIAKFLLQGDFFYAWSMIPLLLVSAVLNCFSVYFGSIYTASMNNKMIMISTIVGATVSVVSSFLLIPVFGIIGAIIATNLSYITINIMRYFDTKRFIVLNIRPFEVISLLCILYIQSGLYLFLDKDAFVAEIVLSLIVFILLIIFNLRKKIRRS